VQRVKVVVYVNEKYDEDLDSWSRTTVQVTAGDKVQVLCYSKKLRDKTTDFTFTIANGGIGFRRLNKVNQFLVNGSEWRNASFNVRMHGTANCYNDSATGVAMCIPSSKPKFIFFTASPRYHGAVSCSGRNVSDRS